MIAALVGVVAGIILGRFWAERTRQRDHEHYFADGVENGKQAERERLRDMLQEVQAKLKG